VGPVALYLLADVVALFQPGRREGAVGRGRVGADHGAAASADLAAQVFQLEAAAGNSGPRHTVLLIHHQSGQGGVLKAEGMAFSGLHKRLLGVAVFDREPCGRLQFLDPEPTVPQAVVRAGQFNAPIFVRCEYAQVVVLTGFRVVAGVPDLETHPGEPVMGDAVLLDDLDNRPLVVIKIRLPVPVGVQGDILIRGVHQIGVAAYGLFGDFEYSRPKVGDGHRAVRPGGHFGHAAAVCLLH